MSDVFAHEDHTAVLVVLIGLLWIEANLFWERLFLPLQFLVS